MARARLNALLSVGITMDTNFLKAHAERCRRLAENADEFTKRRLLDLAAHYDKRLKAAGPSAATRFLTVPLTTKGAPNTNLSFAPEVGVRLPHHGEMPNEKAEQNSR
jgi:hypothetical protein